MEERIHSTVHYSLVKLEEAWNKTTPLIHENLNMSCQTEEKIFLMRWLRRNNVMVVTSDATIEGISLDDVEVWIANMCG